MWTETTRPQYERKGLRYSSDVTDAEWLVISPHLPQRKRFGRPPKTALRSIVDALLYMARTGCQWRLLPREFRLHRGSLRSLLLRAKVPATALITVAGLARRPHRT